LDLYIFDKPPASSDGEVNTYLNLELVNSLVISCLSFTLPVFQSLNFILKTSIMLFLNLQRSFLSTIITSSHSNATKLFFNFPFSASPNNTLSE